MTATMSLPAPLHSGAAAHSIDAWLRRDRAAQCPCGAIEMHPEES